MRKANNKTSYWVRRRPSRILEIKAESEQIPPLRREVQVPARLQGVKRMPVEQGLDFKEGEAPFVGELPAQGQVGDDKGVPRLVPLQFPVLLN